MYNKMLYKSLCVAGTTHSKADEGNVLYHSFGEI